MARPDRPSIPIGPARLSSPKSIRALAQQESQEAVQQLITQIPEIPTSESLIELAQIVEYDGFAGTAFVLSTEEVVEFINAKPVALAPGATIVIWPTGSGQYVCVGVLESAQATIDQAPFVTSSVRTFILDNRSSALNQSLVFFPPRGQHTYDFTTVDLYDDFGLGAPAIFAGPRGFAPSVRARTGIWVPDTQDFYITDPPFPGRLQFYAGGFIVTLAYNNANPASSSWYTFDLVNGLQGPFPWSARADSNNRGTLYHLTDTVTDTPWFISRGTPNNEAMFRFDATNGWEETLVTPRRPQLSSDVNALDTISHSCNGWLVSEGEFIPSLVTNPFNGKIPEGDLFYTSTFYIKSTEDDSEFVSYPRTGLRVLTSEPVPPGFNVPPVYTYPDYVTPIAATGGIPFEASRFVSYAQTSFVAWDGSAVTCLVFGTYDQPTAGTWVGRAVLVNWDVSSDTHTVTYLDEIGFPTTLVDIAYRTSLGNDGYLGVQIMNQSPYTGKIYFCCLSRPSLSGTGVPDDPADPFRLMVSVWSWDGVGSAVLEYYDASVLYKSTGLSGYYGMFPTPWFDGVNVNFVMARNGMAAYGYGSVEELDWEYDSSVFFSVPE